MVFASVSFSSPLPVAVARTSQSPFPMWRNPLRSFRHIGSADYIRRCCSSLRELRTSVNLQNPKNGSKLPSRDFANPPNRYMLCLDKNTAEKPMQKFILFLPNPFLPTLISTFRIFPNRNPMQKMQKELIFQLFKFI